MFKNSPHLHSLPILQPFVPCKPDLRFVKIIQAFIVTRHRLPSSVLASEPICFTEAHKVWKMATRYGWWIYCTHSECPSHNVICYKWIFDLRKRLKDQLILQIVVGCKGFHQPRGIYYRDTFSTIVKPKTICTVLTVAVSYGWPVHQLDVQNVQKAFLYGDLAEEVYMNQSLWFVNPAFPTYACHLRKAVYGFKQAPRSWSIFLVLIELWVPHPHAYYSFFFIFHLVILPLFFLHEDILVTSSMSTCITTIRTDLSSNLIDLGPLHYFLVIEPTRTSSSLLLPQSKYITSLLHWDKMDDSKPSSIQLEMESRFLNLMATHFLAYLITAALLVLCNLNVTWHDLSFSVNSVCQFMHNRQSLIRIH